MNDRIGFANARADLPRPSRLFRLPLRVLTAGIERLLAPRGLAVAFLLLAAAFTVSGWLRPPMSPDLSGLELPLGISRDGPSPEEILHGPRRLLWDSLAVPLLALLAGGMGIVLLRPQQLGTVAGLLLSGALAANAAAALNHPALIELLDREYEQRRQIADVLLAAQEHGNVAYAPQGRITVLGVPAADDQRGDLIRGAAYLLHGRWLVFLAAAGLLLASRGPLRRRLGYLLLWGAAGVGLAAGLCWPRLEAEYAWARAKLLEAQGDGESSRRALDEAVARFPELGRLERTWLLAGKLDQAAGQRTPQEHFFRAYQSARSKDLPRPSGYQEDLPWQVPLSRAYQDRRRALALMDDLLAEGLSSQPAIRNQAARLWTALGLAYYEQKGLYTDSGRDYYPQNRELGAAEHAWRRAAELVPDKRDSAFYLGLDRERVERAHPERVAAELAPAQERLADCLLLADILATAGNASFKAGIMTAARKSYAGSCTAFSLPKIINHRGLAGLGGL